MRTARIMAMFSAQALIYSDKDCCLADPNGSGDALREGERVILSGTDIYEGKVLTQ